jgi:uncharacterized protein (TIGR00725 family)
LSIPLAIAVFGSSRTEPGSSHWSAAEAVGTRLARAGIQVINGGYGGTMEAVSKGAAEAGGEVVGVTAPSLFPGRSGANPYVTELVEAEDLLGRIGTMINRAGGVIALPGSIGTATELLISWNHNYLANRGAGRVKPTAAVGEGWKLVAQALADGAGTQDGDIHLVGTADEAVSWVLGQLQKP